MHASPLSTTNVTHKTSNPLKRKAMSSDSVGPVARNPLSTESESEAERQRKRGPDYYFARKYVHMLVHAKQIEEDMLAGRERTFKPR